jgi:hypothetical protein
MEKLHHKDLHNLNSSLNIVIVAEARRLSSSGQVAFMEETRNVKNIFV